MASSVPLIPAINRNLTSVLDVSESGLIAYGSRCSIYILNFRPSIPVIVDSKFIPNAHRGKVLSVSFCKSNDELIASIGDDNFVRIWDLETRTCIASSEVKECSRVVEWLHGAASSVTFPGACSFISKWNYAKKNSIVHMKTGSDSFVNILSSNKKTPELLAAGHVVGTISIMNMDSQVLMYKLKSHTMEVTSLCWSSVSPSMLLSASLDYTARVWKMGEQKPIRTFSYPKSRKIEDTKKYPVKLCSTFHPGNSDVIICSNVRGCFGEVTFLENEMPKFVSYEERNSDVHFRSVNIILPYVTGNNKMLLLTSDYLKISLWDISEKKLLSSICYVGGNVYDVAPSVIHPHLLGVGAGDGCLRIWNINELPRLDITSIVLLTRIKIMTMAWHPTVEGIIAYGTDEGRIGIADIQRKKSLYAFEAHHSNSIYSMQWAPCHKIKDSNEDLFLYSCGGGVIYIHELHKPKEKPADFDDLITFPPDLEFVQKTHSELSWKSDYTCLIIGSYKGFLDLYDDKFNFLTRVTMQMKIVESVKWHPSYTYTSSKGSEYSSWFAAAGNDDNILIFDTSDIKNGESESALCRPTKTLVGHKKKISSLCWSPHTDGYMASASRDGTVLVWNVITTTIIANYPWHKEIVYAVHWSYFDPDIIYSGGMDCCLRVWKISEQTQSAPERSQVIRRKTKPVHKPKENNSKEDFSVREKERSMDSSCKELCSSENSMNEQPKESEMSRTEEVSTKEDSSNKYIKNKPEFKDQKKGLFSGYVSQSKEKKIENLLKLTDLLSQPLDSSDPENMTLISDMVTDEESVYCGLFCDQLTAIKMLETKAKAEKRIGNIEKGNYLQLMANSVEPLLMDAAENKKLTDFLMAAAITVSRQFYNEMCKKYSVQLIEEKNYVKASMYLLFCGELHNAVKILLEKGRIFEALALAKAQLPADDPYLQGAIVKVSNHFSTHHELENEAACYLALGEPSEAAKTLYRENGNSLSVYVSAYICTKFNLIEEAESYGYLCLEKCLAEAAWPVFYKIIDIIDSLKVYKLLVRVHELIFMQMKTLKKDGLVGNEIFGVAGSKLQIWGSKTFGDSNISFLPFVFDIIKTENIIPEDKESLEKIRNALDSMIAKRQKYETTGEAHINLAIYTSQVIVSHFLNDISLVQKYILKVFPAVHNIVFLPRVVLWLFLPFDIHWCSNKDIFICENKYLESQSFSLPHLQNVYRSLYDKFALLNAFEDFSISQVSLSNLGEVVDQVLSVLSKKTSEDSLILYFSICYITELRKLAKNGWKFRCYNNVTAWDKKIEEVVPGDEKLSAVCDKKDIICNEQKNNTEHVIESDVSHENTSQSTLPAVLSSEENITIQNGASNHDLTQDPNSKENKLTECSTLIDLEDTLPAVLSSEENITIQNGAANHDLTQDPNSKENKLTECSALIDLEDNVKNTENKNTLSSIMFNKLKDFLIPSSNNSDKEIKNGSPEKIENEIRENEISSSAEKFENEISSVVNFENDISSAEKIENEISSVKDNDVKIEENIFSHDINGRIPEKEAFVENTNDKSKETENLSLEKNTDQSIKVEGTFSETDDDHLQCWSDMSLYYILSRSFTFVNCKDEYALFFYFEKYLRYLDSAIADIARQKSTKSVMSNANSLPPVIIENFPLEQNNTCNNMIQVEKNHEENSVLSSLKSVEISDTPKENCFTSEKDLKSEVSDDNEVKNDLIVNSSEKVDLTDDTNTQTNIETTNQKYENNTNSNIHGKATVINEEMIAENLQSEHERVSQLMKRLNSVEFNYPNPFDAVSAINGLCCDIFRKNPCDFVKKKFHTFAHEVNQWNAKFCIKGETVKCDICKEVIHA